MSSNGPIIKKDEGTQMPLFDLASVTPKNGPPSTKFPFVRHLSDDDLAELNLVVQREITGRAP